MISERELSHYSNNGELNFRKFLGKTEIKKVKREFSNFVKYKINKMIIGKDYSLSKSKKIPSSLHRLEKFKESYFYKIAKKKRYNKLCFCINWRRPNFTQYNFS